MLVFLLMSIVTIASFDSASALGQFQGPFEYRGILSAVLVDNTTVHVYQSTDAGTTWAESDAANAPAHEWGAQTPHF